MINVLKTLVSVIVMFVLGSGIANATPPASDWTVELSGIATNAENAANEWASTLGNASPRWVHLNNDQRPCTEGAIAVYCIADSTVYFKPLGISGWSNPTGYVGALLQTGHEITHHFQRMAVPELRATKAFENQAACGSGVFLKWMVNNGRVQDSDVQGLIRAIPTGGTDALHVPVELATAFTTGYDSGQLSVCVMPGYPLAGVPA